MQQQLSLLDNNISVSTGHDIPGIHYTVLYVAEYPQSVPERNAKMYSMREKGIYNDCLIVTHNAEETLCGPHSKGIRISMAAAKYIGLIQEELAEHKSYITIPSKLTNQKSSVDMNYTALRMIVDFLEYTAKYAADFEIQKPLRTTLEELLKEAGHQKYIEFLQIDQGTLIELIIQSNLMSIKPLLELTCAKVASMIKGKSPEQIREMFGIENDFTPEEEERIREENKWCEES